MNKSEKKLLIVAPYRDEEDFLATMAARLNASIESLVFQTNVSVSRGVWLRHAVNLRVAFKAFQRSGSHDMILFGEQFMGLYYALFCRIFFWQKPNARCMVLQLIYNRKSGWKGSLYRRVYGWLIESHCLHHLVCHASHERVYYQRIFGGAASQKINFVAFGRDKPIEKKDQVAIIGQRYYFAGGTSNRDYRTLIEAFRGIPCRLIIACHSNDVKGIDIPDNVIVRHDMFGEAFQQCLDSAYAVVLPILHTDVSAGQLVLIDAMRSGKASIVTAGSCMEDYVDVSCAITVPRLGVAALREAVQKLNQDEATCFRLGEQAKYRYERLFTRKGFADRLCDIYLSSAVTA